MTLTISPSRATLFPMLTLCAMICLGITACEVIEALRMFPLCTALQRQAGVFVPLLWVWTRIEHLT